MRKAENTPTPHPPKSNDRTHTRLSSPTTSVFILYTLLCATAPSCVGVSQTTVIHDECRAPGPFARVLLCAHRASDGEDGCAQSASEWVHWIFFIFFPHSTITAPVESHTHTHAHLSISAVGSTEVDFQLAATQLFVVHRTREWSGGGGSTSPFIDDDDGESAACARTLSKAVVSRVWWWCVCVYSELSSRERHLFLVFRAVPSIEREKEEANRDDGRKRKRKSRLTRWRRASPTRRRWRGSRR